MKALGLAVLILTVSAIAQDAVVVELSPEDASSAKQAYEAKLAADAAWDALHAKLLKKYALRSVCRDQHITSTAHQLCLHTAADDVTWALENGIGVIYQDSKELSFSKDFRFLVPAVNMPHKWCWSGLAWEAWTPGARCYHVAP